MPALRLLLFFIITGTSVPTFACTFHIGHTQSQSHDGTSFGLYEDNESMPFVPDLKTERLIRQYTRLKSKVKFHFGQIMGFSSTKHQPIIRFEYLKYSNTIPLKLRNHTIAYPFHSFP